MAPTCLKSIGSFQRKAGQTPLPDRLAAIITTNTFSLCLSLRPHKSPTTTERTACGCTQLTRGRPHLLWRSSCALNSAQGVRCYRKSPMDDPVCKMRRPELCKHGGRFHLLSPPPEETPAENYLSNTVLAQSPAVVVGEHHPIDSQRSPTPGSQGPP